MNKISEEGNSKVLSNSSTVLSTSGKNKRQGRVTMSIWQEDAKCPE